MEEEKQKDNESQKEEKAEKQETPNTNSPTVEQPRPVFKQLSSSFTNVKWDRNKILTVIASAVLVLTLFNTYGIFFSNPQGGGVTGNVVNNNPNPIASPAPTIPAPTPGKVNIEIGDAPIKGDKNAPVTIIEFSDYQCPFCSRFYSDTLSQIDEQYIKTGKVKFAYKDFPLSFHPLAQKSAEAAKCVRDQDGDEGYWALHDKIFENQGSLSLDNLKQWAREVGADGGEFDTCLDSGKFASDVQAEFREGQGAGVRGTPAFFVNGKLLSGAQPFVAFKQAIDAEL